MQELFFFFWSASATARAGSLSGRLEARTEQPDPGQLAREQAGHDAPACANKMSSFNRGPRTTLQKAAVALEALFRAIF